MKRNIEKLVSENPNDFFRYFHKVSQHESRLLLKGQLLEILKEFKKENQDGDHNAIEEVVRSITESVCIGSNIYISSREKIAEPSFHFFNVEDRCFECITVLEFLKAKEGMVVKEQTNNVPALNFKTFYDKFPSVRDPKSIGRGVEYLNRYLSSKMFTEPEKLRLALFNFLFVHKYKNQQLILNDRIKNTEQLSKNIDKALTFLRKRDDEEPFTEVKHTLQEFGFEQGLGNKVGNLIASLEQLDNLLHSPDHNSLKNFLSGVPMIFNIAVISPHGFFGQEGVLGKPDTGGQVVYILDQVKALEKEMTLSLKTTGVDAVPKIIILTRLIPNSEGTKSDQRLEKVHETENCWILRVPFRTHNKNVTDNWISRFEIWPYLEEFAEDSFKELSAEFEERPDLIIGNYSDGNLVASILSKKFGVTQCNIAHALEKSKYLYSALYWKNLEDQYHFSVQYTADLLSMNSANFIITSTYQEIAGTEESVGQYESYLNFTMPYLYRVVGGINLFHPKFNIVPPGVNTKIYFSYKENENRLKEIRDELNKLLFENADDPDVYGKLENPDLLPVFSLARLDKIKNLTSLVRWFGESPQLQEISNLIIVAGVIDENKSTDGEEKEQIRLMYELINHYNLHNKIRWIGKLFRKDQTGEVYRIIADRKGIFVQPALFEGFGLTVLEAMRSGLPVFATMYGGPSEIIQDHISGFHINPVNEKECQEIILSFFDRCKKDPKYWDKISERAIKRVDTAFNWELYSKSLLSLAKIYGFWRYTTNIEMEEMNAYLDVIYHLLYLPRAKQLLEKHNQR